MCVRNPSLIDLGIRAARAANEARQRPQNTQNERRRDVHAVDHENSQSNTSSRTDSQAAADQMLKDLEERFGSSTESVQKAFLDAAYKHAYGTTREADKAFPDDATEWNERYFDVVTTLQSRRLQTPNGKVGRDVTRVLADEFERWNTDPTTTSGRAIVFITCVLQPAKGVSKACTIRRRISKALEDWDEGRYDDLIKECKEREAELSSAYRSGKKKQEDPEHVSKIFTKLMLLGKTKAAINWATREQHTRVYLPEEEISDKGVTKTVLESLKAKHPAASPAPSEALKHIINTDPLPRVRNVVASEEDVEKAARAMQGSAGPSGIDAALLQRMLTCHGNESKALRDALAKQTMIVANEDVPWWRLAEARSGREIALGQEREGGGIKIRPIGIGETWERLKEKIVIQKTKQELLTNVGIDNLSTGIKAGPEAEVQALIEMLTAMEDSSDGETYVLVKLDADNAFNRLNRDVAILNCRLYWPSASRYVLNTYKGNPLMFVRGRAQTFTIVSEEGVTQGSPMAMLVFAVRILPLIRRLSTLTAQPHPSLTHGEAIVIEDTQASDSQQSTDQEAQLADIRQ